MPLPVPRRPWLAHQPVVKAVEVDSLPADLQVHDPGLGLLRLEPEFGQQGPKPRQRGLGLLT
jgi:hypothetical protein